MASTYCAPKSKWNSQQIQKRCKNKHHNGLYAAWRKYSNACSNANPSRSWTKFCNEYKKDIYSKRNTYNDTHIFDEYEVNLYETQYWRCNLCTFDNNQRDLYCSICKSPFKSSYDITKTSEYISTQSTATLSDYLPSQYTNDIAMYHQDDFAEDIQIAIALSYEHTHQIHTDSEDSQHSDNDIYTYDEEMYINNYNLPTEHVLDGCYKYKSIKTKNRKQYNMKTDEESVICIKTKKQWCLHKTFSAKQKKRRKDKSSTENKKLRRNHKKCLRSLPQLSKFINKTKINYIKNDIADSYSSDKPFHMKCIVNYNILCKFGCGTKESLKLVYHGTNDRNNMSIIQNGLIVGGTKGVGIKNGAAYGKGVYCSPDTSTARWYESGSMFVCVVKGCKVRRSGTIWVVPRQSNILPLFLASFGGKSRVSVPQNKVTVNKSNDGLSQKILKFIPSFTLLNEKHVTNRKIKRKWNAYFKLNKFIE